MAGREFTGFCAALLRARGYRQVRRARHWGRHWGRRRVAVDLLARAPDGARVAVRCAPAKDAVNADAIASLHAAVTGGRLAGRAVTLVTNALVTPDARALAAEQGITVTDRAGLRHWMELARGGPRAPGGALPGDGPRPPSSALPGDGPRPPSGALPGSDPRAPGEGRVPRRRIRRPLLVIVAAGSGAALVVIGIVVNVITAAPARQPPAPRPAGLAVAGSAAIPGTTPVPVPSARPVPARPSTPPAPTRPHITKKPAFATKRLPAPPAKVVRAFYAAISSHDWELVWRLGGRNLGYGPYATYQGMVGGYAQTARDSLTTLRVTGDTVSGSFRAYQSDGTVRSYQFSYVVRGGAIVSGQQREVLWCRRVTVPASYGAGQTRWPSL